MPEVHPTLPIGSGGNQNFSVTGGWEASVSGSVTVSGDTSAVGALSGPWFIEEQYLSIQYKRVPLVSRSMFQDADVSLSGVGVMSGTIVETALIALAFPIVRKWHSTDYYATNQYQQPQKFMLAPEMYDYKGNAYGTIGEFSGTPTNQPMGPAGNIFCAQKYHNRRLWQAGDELLVAGGYRFTYQFYPGYKSVDGSFSGRLRAGDMMLTQIDWMHGTWQDLREIHQDVSGNAPAYRLPGRYSYTQEINAGQMLIDLLDSVGTRINTGNLWRGRPDHLFGIASYAPAIPEYDINRHDYT